MAIKFTSSPKELTLLEQVADRAVKLAKASGFSYPRQDAQMDVTACHLNGNPLDLPKLLRADDFNFAHDVFGIRQHLDRTTGELLDFFSPRCSA